jgi:nicotinamide mononucleotide adenylyltransferase
MLEELIEDEEDRAFRDEETRLFDQIQFRENIMYMNREALEEKRADVFQRIRDFEYLKNQSESDESMIPVLADIKRQLEEDIEALHEYEKTIKDEERASNEEIRKLLQDRAKVVAQRREKNNESDSESDSE